MKARMVPWEIGSVLALVVVPGVAASEVHVQEGYVQGGGTCARIQFIESDANALAAACAQLSACIGQGTNYVGWKHGNLPPGTWEPLHAVYTLHQVDHGMAIGTVLFYGQTSTHIYFHFLWGSTSDWDYCSTTPPP